MKKELALLFATIVSFCLVVGGSAEIGLRIYMANNYDHMLSNISPGVRCFRSSNVTGLYYEHIPSICGVNALGFPGQQFQIEKPKGVKRVVIIGDSVAFGSGLATFNKTFSAQLDGLFQRKEYDVQILTFAVPGYSTQQELILLRSALNYSPDVIIWSYVLNDARTPPYDPTLDMEYFYHPPSYLYYWFKMHYIAFEEKLATKNCPLQNRTGGAYTNTLLYCTQWNDIPVQFARIKQNAKNIPVIFMVQPYFESRKEMFDNYKEIDVHEKLQDAAAQMNFTVVDILEAYRGHSMLELRSDAWHPNEKGHQIIAQALLPIVEEKLGLNNSS